MYGQTDVRQHHHHLMPLPIRGGDIIISCAGGRHNMPPPLWPFHLENGVQVTCDVGYLCASFSLPRPLCSRLRPDVRNRQTDVRQHHHLMPLPRGRGHNNIYCKTNNNKITFQPGVCRDNLEASSEGSFWPIAWQVPEQLRVLFILQQTCSQKKPRIRQRTERARCAFLNASVL